MRRVTITAAFYFLLACVILFWSGAGGIPSVAKLGYGGLIALIAFLHAAAFGLRRAVGGPWPEFNPVTMLAAVILIFSWMVSTAIDNIAHNSTERMGAAIVADIAAHGTCPTALSEIPAYANGLPRPALRNTEFVYRTHDHGDCAIEFFGAAGLYCAYRLSGGEWFCDD